MQIATPGWGQPPTSGGPRSTAGIQRNERDVFSERFGEASPRLDQRAPLPDEDGDERGEGPTEETDDEDEDADDAEVEYTLKDRQDAINAEHPFGLPIWKPALYKKSRSITRNAETDLHLSPSYAAERHLLPGNLLWSALFGLPLACVCAVAALVLFAVPWGGPKYARVVFELGTYLFWPFGRYVVSNDERAPTLPTPQGYDYEDEEEDDEEE